MAWARSVEAPRRRSRWSWFDAIAVSSETLAVTEGEVAAAEAAGVKAAIRGLVALRRVGAKEGLQCA